MFFSSSKKDEGRVIGIIDIGSAQVSGAIVKLGVDREIESVLAQADEKITYQELPEFEHFWTVTQKALQTLLQELRANTKNIAIDKKTIEPEKIFIFLSSPFFQSQTKVIKASNPNAVKITKNYLADLIKQADSQNNLTENTVILEDKIMQTKLDGYLTTWPLGQKAQEITLNRFLSWADKNLLINIRDVIRAEYAKTPVIFNTFSFAIYDIFKDFLPDKDFILLDTGNEITDVLIIKDNVLVEHFSFPGGKNFLLRNIAKALKTVPVEAETSLNLYATGQANTQLKTHLAPALNKIKSLWLSNLKEALTKAINTTFLPENIYFIGDEPIDNIFVEFIDQADFNEITLSNHKINAVFVEKLLTDGLTHLTGKVQPLTNSCLLAETLFCAKI
jgi:cell division ATPase FtsA